jgi:dihydropteroate synthase
MKPWLLRDRALDVSRRALIMGIVNVTPDSFSDGGRFAGPDAALAHGLEMVRDGADILDIGGESTRPGAEAVSLDEERRRVLPVVAGLRAASGVVLSIDTSKAALADEALQAGADIVNDITAGGDPAMAGVVAKHRAGVILMHMQGTPQTMQDDPRYGDVVADIREFLKNRITAFVAAGVQEDQIAIDPGIGFGKTLAHNLEILARLPEFLALGRPICLGVSRKGFIGQIIDRPRSERAVGSAAIAAYGMTRGAVHIVRVHDVPEHRDVVRLLAVLKSAGRPV